ncbi:hypothetical protein [Kocuria kalidii]|uniref:hypothetical protein n=1 Tax=Kocuria kalidii TaxID=3376283 RepID=UPI0037BE0A6B
MSSTAIVSPIRVWDLKPGDTFRGRTIVTIDGEVGLANNPVAVIFYEGCNHSVRISAVHSDVVQGYDPIRFRARAWIHQHGLHEGDAVDIQLLRGEVLDSALAA